MTLVESYQKIEDFRQDLNDLKEQLSLGIGTNTAVIVARMSSEIDTLCTLVFSHKMTDMFAYLG